MSHWIYENWTAESKAVIHAAVCGHCRDGSGCHPNPLGKQNGRWLGPFDSLATAESEARALGRPLKLHSCCKPSRPLTLLLSASLFVACTPAKEPTMLERYPGPWKEDINVPIIKTLAFNKVRTCATLKYRESAQHKGEFFVYCSVDGSLWTAYIVWPNTERLMGPYPPDPTIPAQ